MICTESTIDEEIKFIATILCNNCYSRNVMQLLEIKGINIYNM